MVISLQPFNFLKDGGPIRLREQHRRTRRGKDPSGPVFHARDESCTRIRTDEGIKKKPPEEIFALIVVHDNGALFNFVFWVVFIPER